MDRASICVRAVLTQPPPVGEQAVGVQPPHLVVLHRVRRCFDTSIREPCNALWGVVPRDVRIVPAPERDRSGCSDLDQLLAPRKSVLRRRSRRDAGGPVGNRGVRHGFFIASRSCSMALSRPTAAGGADPGQWASISALISASRRSAFFTYARLNSSRISASDDTSLVSVPAVRM